MKESSPAAAAAAIPADESAIDSNTSSSNNGRKNHVVKKNLPVTIRAKKELDRKLLVAATEGDIAYLESVRLGHSKDCSDEKNRSTERGLKILKDAVCVSGCTLLHWAAGSNQVGVLEYLLSPLHTSSGANHDKADESSESEATSKDLPAIFCDHDFNTYRAVDLPVTKCKKSLGRTPLHYACRNGCLEAVQWLVLVGGASIDVQAKQGVTPFQLAVWQNRLEICIFLTETAKTKHKTTTCSTTFDPAKDFNDFGCGAVHWLGIAPESRANFRRENSNDDDHTDNENDGKNSDSWYHDGRDLLPLARWLAALPGIDFSARQRQNHTGLHKASWGGHLALVEYLHTEHDMWDEIVDDAGNYAASLADMAHTPKHAEIANYLRKHCNRKRAESLSILGLPSTGVAPTKETIRKAYLARARQLHPDRLVAKAAETRVEDSDVGEAAGAAQPQGGECTAPPTTISFDALRKAYIHLTEEDGVGDQSNPAHSLNLMLRYVNNSASSNTADTKKGKGTTQQDASIDGEEDDSFFKARLVAVLLEYGDKGIDLSNVKKKWKQVWPKIPFPSQVSSSHGKKIPMAEFLLSKAGDVIRFERHGEKKRRVLVLLKNRNSSKESVLRSGFTTVASDEQGRQ